MDRLFISKVESIKQNLAKLINFKGTINDCLAPVQPYQADSDGSGHDMVWLDLSA